MGIVKSRFSRMLAITIVAVMCIALITPLMANAEESLEFNDFISDVTLSNNINGEMIYDDTNVTLTQNMILQYSFDMTIAQCEEIYKGINPSDMRMGTEYEIVLPEGLEWSNTVVDSTTINMMVMVNINDDFTQKQFGQLTVNWAENKGVVYFGGDFWDDHYTDDARLPKVAIEDGYLYLTCQLDEDIIGNSEECTITLMDKEVHLKVPSNEGKSLSKKGEWIPNTTLIQWTIEFETTTGFEASLYDVYNFKKHEFVEDSMEITDGTTTTPVEVFFPQWGDPNNKAMRASLGMLEDGKTYTITYKTQLTPEELELKENSWSNPANITAGYGTVVENQASILGGPETITSNKVRLTISANNKAIVTKTGSGFRWNSSEPTTWTIVVNTLGLEINDFVLYDNPKQDDIDSVTLNGDPVTVVAGKDGNGNNARIVIPLPSAVAGVPETHTIVVKTKGDVSTSSNPQEGTRLYINENYVSVDMDDVTSPQAMARLTDNQAIPYPDWPYISTSKTGTIDRETGIITWRVGISCGNEPGQPRYPYVGVITDDFTTRGMTYVDGSFEAVSPSTATLKSSSANKIEIDVSASNPTAASNTQYFTFQTKVTDTSFFAYNQQQILNNEVKFEGTLNGEPETSEARYRLIVNTSVLTKMTDAFDRDSRTISYAITVNPDKIPMPDAIVEETIPNNMTYKPGSLKVDGTPTEPTSIEDGIISIDIGDKADRKTVTIILDYIINVDEIDAFYNSASVNTTNTAKLIRDAYPETSKTQASTSYSIRNEMLTKNGVVDGENNKIDYTVNINPNSVNLGDLTLKDEFGPDQVVDMDSVQLFKASASNASTPVYTITEPVEANITREDGAFVVRFPEGNTAYVLKYSCNILTPSDDYSNTISFETGVTGSVSSKGSRIFAANLGAGAYGVMAASTTATIEGTKRVVNGYEPSETEYEFELTADPQEGMVLPENMTTYNEMFGKFAFDDIEFTEAGTYHLTVTEIPGRETGMIYDDTEYEVEIIVKDEGGILVVDSITYNGASSLVITNTVTDPAPTTLALGGEKRVTGPYTIAGNEFEFELTADEEYDTAKMPSSLTTKANASGVFRFDEIEFSDIGMYKFTITEKDTGIEGMTYYTKDIKVEVYVDYRAATHEYYIYSVKYDGQADLRVTNTYVAPHVPEVNELQIRGMKNVTGDDYTMTAGEFEFTLSADAQTGVKLPSNLKATNDINGNIVFDKIEFSQAGTFNFQITETAGSVEGMSYFSSPIDVVVTVELEKDYEVKSVTYDGAETLTINNTYTKPEDPTPEPSEYQIKMNKKMAGDPYVVANNEFEFTLALKSGNADNVTMPDTLKVTNDADGNIVFDKVGISEPGTYEFTVTETPGTNANMSYGDAVTITINALEGEDRVIEGGDYVNTYTKPEEPTPEPSEYQFTIQKVMDGDTYKLADGEFEFTLGLKSGDAESVTMPETVKVTNDADGNITFDKVTITKPGIYEFTVSETPGTDENMDYGDAVTIGITVLGGEDEIVDGGEYVNTYTKPGTHVPEPATFTLEGTKVVEGDEYSISEDEFEFTLSYDDKTETVTNNEDGTFSFSEITFGETGTYELEVTETVGTTEGMTYMDEPVIVTVEVELDNDYEVKTVTYNTGDALVVTNTYEAVPGVDPPVYEPKPAKFTLEGTKVVKGDEYALAEDEFEFTLSFGDKTETVKNKADGTFSFDEITFDKEGTYELEVTEAMGTTEGMTYVTGTMTVTVEVELDTDYEVKAVTYSTGDALVVTNTYEAPEKPVDPPAKDDPATPDRPATKAPAEKEIVKTGQQAIKGVIIGLAAIALISGLGLVWLRRKPHRRRPE